MKNPTATVQIDPVDRARGIFDVTCRKAEDDQVAVVFRCISEADALEVRRVLRDHADELRRVYDYNR